MNDLQTLEKQDLVDIIQKRDAEIDALLKINQELKGFSKLEDLLIQIMNITKEMMNSEACSLLLIHEETQEFIFYTANSEQKLDETSFHKGNGITKNVVTTGKPVIVNNVQEHPKFHKGADDRTGFVARSMMCVPMTIEKKIMGTVQTLNKIDGEYTEHDLHLLNLISAQVAMAIEYVRVNEQKILRERMATVGSMASAIIHDLRNSMHVISGFTQIISIEDENASFTEYCEAINREVDKLINISHELLEFSRGSKISLSVKATSLNDYLRFFYHQTKKLHEEKGIDFTLELYDDCNMSLDQDKMARAIQNLIRNARVALEENPEKKIILKGGLNEGLPVIIVEDNSKGMDPKTLKNVFKPFYSKEKKGVIGLELAITESIVRGHKATIKAESEIGIGTRIRQRLKQNLRLE
ncbi:MAG: GAF domain-containing protein [Deltaproteobacteria bacterium]|nr:GAF domain-containing protein [Deltaproteobacteria bacterium]